jgi:outer membrane protein assembly factor BamB
MPIRTCLGILGGLLACWLAGPGRAASRTAREIKRYAAAEATQAVAVDRGAFYAIGNHAIGKYDKKSGARLKGWECPEGKPLIHLNSGVVHEGKLYCAHSNYPGVPNTGSIEIWDTRTLEHVASHSFGIYGGSTAWIERHRGAWYVGFAQYLTKGGDPNRDPSWTTIVKFDAAWNRLEGWVYPAEIVRRFGRYSSSGGVVDAAGRLYATGHDARELYVLNFPTAGSVLELVEVVDVPFAGQGIAWDRSQAGVLYAVSKSSREVVVVKIE